MQGPMQGPIQGDTVVDLIEAESAVVLSLATWAPDTAADPSLAQGGPQLTTVPWDSLRLFCGFDGGWRFRCGYCFTVLIFEYCEYYEIV